jgi:hypothetical protein
MRGSTEMRLGMTAGKGEEDDAGIGVISLIASTRRSTRQEGGETER